MTTATFDPVTDFPTTDPLGALFGLLDFERRISGRNQQTLAQMHLRQYVRHPKFVLPTLMDLHIHTAAKLRRRRGMAQLETMIHAVAGALGDLPSMLTPAQATAVHVGYAKTMAFLRERYSEYTGKRDAEMEEPEIDDFDDASDDDEEGGGE